MTRFVWGLSGTAVRVSGVRFFLLWPPDEFRHERKDDNEQAELSKHNLPVVSIDLRPSRSPGDQPPDEE